MWRLSSEGSFARDRRGRWLWTARGRAGSVGVKPRGDSQKAVVEGTASCVHPFDSVTPFESGSADVVWMTSRVGWCCDDRRTGVESCLPLWEVRVISFCAALRQRHIRSKASSEVHTFDTAL